MKKKLVTLLAFVTTALVLVACGGAPGGGIELTPTYDATQFDGNYVAKVGSGTVMIRVNTDVSGELIVFETSSAYVNSITVYDGNKNPIGASNSPLFFVGPDEIGALTASTSNMETMLSVTPTSWCFGPCVIAERGSATSTNYFYVEIDADEKVELYAYMAGIGDIAEDHGGNDTRSTAYELTIAEGVHTGAFETLADEDWYLLTEDADIVIKQTGAGWGEGLDLLIELYPGDHNPPVIDYSDPASKTFTIQGIKDDLIRLRTVSDRAGDFESSEYEIKLVSPL